MSRAPREFRKAVRRNAAEEVNLSVISVNSKPTQFSQCESSWDNCSLILCIYINVFDFLSFNAQVFVNVGSYHPEHYSCFNAVD